MTAFLRPCYFFLGIFLGLLLCSVLGNLISQKARLHQFSRFFRHIIIEMDYFPTAAELLVTAKRKANTNDILVIIGGNSIFRGEGQNPNELWSKQLQKELGKPYKVINYAANGAAFPAFGAVAFKLLSQHYPKIIFVANTPFNENRPIDGGELYNFLFWDAYYKNLFSLSKAEENIIKQLRREQYKTSKGIEMHIMSYLDHVFYFKSLWNWVGYRHVFTVWNKHTPLTAFQAKRYYKDPEYNIKESVYAIKQDKKNLQLEIENFKKSFLHFDAKQASFLHTNYQNIFDIRYRKNILAVLAIHNPDYLAKLNPVEQRQYKLVVDHLTSLIQSLGYNVMQLRDLQSYDFMDLQHLVASGGNKAAKQIAAQVKMIAVREGFLADRIV